MATITTRYGLGDRIEFAGPDGDKRIEIVKLIECQLVLGFGRWIRYGYGDLFDPEWVSEHKILTDQERIQ